MIRRLRLKCALAAAGAALAGCTDGPPSGPGLNGVSAIAISDTSTVVSAAASGGSSVASLVGTGSRSIAYVSLSPGSIPLGRGVVITNKRTGFWIAQSMTNGGFDPIGVEARPGDAIEAVVDLSTGESHLIIERVPLREPPAIVRTVPPRKKKDVPLNARIMIVFTEPVHSTTINGIRLMRGDAAVAGTATLGESGVAVTFSPDEMLLSLTDYRIVVDGVRDLDGEALESRFESSFTTAANQPTSDATHLAILAGGPIYVGAFTSLNAALENADGEGLVVPATWASSDTTIVTIDPSDGTAFALGHAVGSATIRATVGSQAASITATVTTLEADSIQITGGPEAYVGDTVALSIRAFHETEFGQRMLWGLATWTIQDSSKATVVGSGPSPWGRYFQYVVARDTGAATLTAAAFGKTATITLAFTRPETNMRVLGDFLPADINDSGAIAGGRRAQSGWRPVLYRSGTVTDLGILPGYTECYPTDLNNSGDVVGSCWNSSPGQFRAFVWKSGALTNLGALPGDGASHAAAINDSGQAVGYSQGSSGTRAVIWAGAAIRALKAVGTRTGALDINASGQVAGWSANGDAYRAALWQGDSVVDLGLSGSAVAINRSGEIVVSEIVITHGRRARLWRSGSVTDLLFDAAGITDSGLVFGGEYDGVPLVWAAGTLRDLGVIPKNADGAVTGINERGQAVGIVNGVGVIWDLNQPAALRAPSRLR